MNDIYTDVTTKIIAELEAGTVPWIKPWSGDADPVPRNALSQRPYRGINTIVLGMEAYARGYASNQWLTFRQAHLLGGHVRKDEHATMIIYYELKPIADRDDEEERRVPMLKVFHVFNVEQVDGLPDSLRPVPAADPAWDPCEKAEQIISGSGATILHQGFKAFYSPATDKIWLPSKGSFGDATAYYATALHETTHWTGHPTRLGRQLGRRFGESAFAVEEIVAEMGAAFLCAHCRLDGRLQHASYISSWLDVLRRDKRAVFVAAAQAQKAADYLLERAGLITPVEAMPVAA